MSLFEFQTAGKMVLGAHAAEQCAPYVNRLGDVRSALIVSQPSMQRSGFVDTLTQALAKEGIHSAMYCGVSPEPTERQLTDIYEQAVAGADYDVMIGVGGGSVLDATKLLAVMATSGMGVRDMLGTGLVRQKGIPTVLIPTTSGTGSEVTPNAIVTLPEEELKLAVVSPYLYPQLVLLDPVLTLTLPQPITAATGMDAFTHSLESYISNKGNPLSDMFALESIRLIAASLEEAYGNGTSLPARERMLLGSMYGGMALSCSGTAAVHALAYPLGGKFHITHGVANSMLLSHVMEFNFDAIVDRLSDVAAAMKLPEAQAGSAQRAAEAVIGKIRSWTADLHIPQNLREYGVREDDIEVLSVAAAKVTRLLNNNPKQVGMDDIRALYRKLLA
ncbi:iron-containing alcohol dehydrogenase [Paenibacillus thalictri]|uniref:Iron-containing alcohol dehydrogenase n=1 Tax=Paenibacillus thalictri TaxID=2527873 RepID=A0A4Q9DTF0_9BACL|nr:iron-containing alcohol dehydrogenase [Paenibacillus thalictri]TBL79415.1 iron-containing alcohol dehydrogenase [Paenibacillus thalictri]